ncbi:MAG: hypothetical protein L0177_20835 [Chloroflexi bacterium]|nr:hypothetical protein [Chloroflexota bacterium]
MPRPSTAIHRELRQIRTAFRQLARSFGRVAPLLAAQDGKPEPQEKPQEGKRRKPRLSAALRRAQKLQGKYMGTMRGLKPAQQARVKKLRAEKGIRAAIAAAKRMAG